MPWVPLGLICFGALCAGTALLQPAFLPAWPPLGWVLLALVGAFLVVVGADAWRHRRVMLALSAPPLQPSQPPGATGPLGGPSA